MIVFLFLADFSGNKGVVHFIHNTSDLDWLVQHGVAGPYMAVLPPNMFVRYDGVKNCKYVPLKFCGTELNYSI